MKTPNAIDSARAQVPAQGTGPRDVTHGIGHLPAAARPGDPLSLATLATMGTQDPMSEQQMQSMPTSLTEANGVWKQRVGAAKITWGKLTDDELMQTEGHMQKLAGLVQERYAVSRDEAVTQIKTFFAQFKTEPKAP